MNGQARIFMPPYPVPRRASVFLAGSIEIGVAIDWQKEVTEALQDIDVDIYNPRRLDWDSSWEQKMSNPNFYGQVTWELDQLERSDIIFMYFDPNTKSPISLLELGMFVNTKRMVVVCPDGFWRKGNVEVVCDRADTMVWDSLAFGIANLKYNIERLQK